MTYDQWKLATPPEHEGDDRPVKEWLVCQVCYRPVETERESYGCSEDCRDIVTAYVERDMV